MGGVRRAPGRALGWLLAACAWGGSGCGSSTAIVPETPVGTARTSQGARVPYPPPPAKVEVVPLRRRDECLWRDGFWMFKGAGWRWTPGAWVIPPLDCTYTRSETRWVKEGGNAKLFYFPPEWQPEEPGGKCEEPKSCSSLLPESKAKTRDPLKPNP